MVWPSVGVLDLQAAGLLFPSIWCLLLVISEAVLEASAGSLRGRPGACLLVGEAGSWPYGG